MADRREAPPTWTVRIVLYDGTSVTHTWEDAASAAWHVLGLMIGRFPARRIIVERPTHD